MGWKSLNVQIKSTFLRFWDVEKREEKNSCRQLFLLPLFNLWGGRSGVLQEEVQPSLDMEVVGLKLPTNCCCRGMWVFFTFTVFYSFKH